MQNSAIESRTRLRLDTEIEDMQQKLTGLKLNSEDARRDLSGYRFLQSIIAVQHVTAG